jgi:hypothetical protein
MAKSEKVAKVGDVTPKEMAAMIGERIVEEFEKAGLSGYQHCVMCAETTRPESMAALVLPFENIDVDEQAIDPATGLIVICHVLMMMDNAFEAMGRRDLKDDVESFMKEKARATMTIGRLVSVTLPKMAEDGGTPIVWEIAGEDEGSVLVIADGRHFSDIDGLPDAYVMGSLLDFFIEMAVKGAGQTPTGAEMRSIIDDLESEINGEKGDQDE